MKNIKTLTLGILIGAVTTVSITALAEYLTVPNPYPVKVNGIETAIEGYNINDNTYFKLRDIANAVGGFEVGFSDNTITIDTGKVVMPAPVENNSEIVPTGKKTSDGILIYKINNKEYINGMLTYAKYDTGKYHIYHTNNDNIYLETNTKEIVFSDIPGFVANEHILIELKYYESTLYPYLNQYCK